MAIAETIFEQLGGRRFVTMTGCNQFLSGENYLMFHLPRNQSKANRVRIMLKSDDTYVVEFMKYRGLELKTLKEIDGVYVENLRQVFENVTGLYTTL